MKSILLVLSFIGLVSFCSKDEDPQIAAALIGKWIWIESSGGIAGVIKTPSTTGNEITIEFTAKKFTKFVNGIVDLEMTYKIETGSSIRSKENTFLIIYENDQKQSIELNGNKLILFDECYDCFQYEYLKE